MRRVVCFGEALIDFLNTGQELADGAAHKVFTQFPGGAPANAAVAAAKLGADAAFAGQVGDDPFGTFIIDALERYGVDTSLTLVHPDAPTALAFVFLDANGERSFSFRRDRTADVVMTEQQVGSDWFVGRPILHFCSNTLTDAHIAGVTRYVVDQARSGEATISFDVNLRHNLWPRGVADAEAVNNLVRQSDVVKFSKDELDFLCGGDRDAYLESAFAAGLKAALVTDGPGDIEVATAESRSTVSPPATDVVDTTGGGDAFIGAVLYGLSLQDDVTEFLLNVDRLTSLVASAARCGAIAVSRKGAFPSFPTFDDVANTWSVQ
ncbi:MAG: carbohydrate kinase [Woeseiaceae bacterium]|nr:carbohydrate kinase [Woeseiaceae bacterium]